MISTNDGFLNRQRNCSGVEGQSPELETWVVNTLPLQKELKTIYYIQDAIVWDIVLLLRLKLHRRGTIERTSFFFQRKKIAFLVNYLKRIFVFKSYII